MIQIPYEEIGIGIAVIFGVWSFVISDTVKERAFLAGIPAVVFLLRLVLPGPAGRIVSLIGWMLYGIGCIVHLRFKGMEIR